MLQVEMGAQYISYPVAIESINALWEEINPPPETAIWFQAATELRYRLLELETVYGDASLRTQLEARRLPVRGGLGGWVGGAGAAEYRHICLNKLRSPEVPIPIRAC